LTVVGSRCDIVDPKNPKKVKSFELTGCQVVLIDSSKTLFQGYAKIPIEGKNPSGDTSGSKCFISITPPKAEKPMVFQMEHADHQKWMNLFGGESHELITKGLASTNAFSTSSLNAERPANIFIFGPPQAGKTALTKRITTPQGRDVLGQPVPTASVPGDAAVVTQKQSSSGLKTIKKMGGSSSSSTPGKGKVRNACLMKVHNRNYRVAIWDFNSMAEMEQNISQFAVANTLVVILVNICDKEGRDKLSNWLQQVKKMSRGGKSHLLVVFTWLDHWNSLTRGTTSEKYCKGLIDATKSIWQDFGALTVHWRNLTDKGDIWANRVLTTCLENLLKEAPTISIKEKEEIKASGGQVIVTQVFQEVSYGATHDYQQADYQQQGFQQQTFQQQTFSNQQNFQQQTYGNPYQAQDHQGGGKSGSSLAFLPGGDVGHIRVYEEAQFLVNGTLHDGRQMQGTPAVSIFCKDGLNYPYSLIDHQDGQYTISHTPTLPGEYTVQITSASGEPVQKFKIIVDGPIDPSRSYVEHHGPMFGEVGQPQHFTVHLQDASGRPTTQDQNLNVFFTTMDGAPVKDIHVVKTARPGEDGVYDYTITSPLQGQFLKHVVANGKPLQGGPFVCTFGTKGSEDGSSGGLQASSKKFELKALTGGGAKTYEKGKPNVFVVQLKDKAGKPVTDAGRVDVQFTDTDGNLFAPGDIDVKITADQNGAIQVQYLPKQGVDGNLLATIMVDGVPLETGPITIHTLRPLAALSTIAQQSKAVARGQPAKFVVKLKKGDGTPVTGELSVVYTDIHDNEVTGVQSTITKDPMGGEGDYVVSSNYNISGALRAYVLLDGQPFMAPLEIYVEPPVGETPADPERCVVQGFQQERVVSAGEEVKFKVMLLDSNGQPTDGSFPEIIFGDEFGNMVEDVDVTLNKLPGKGSYEVAFTPQGTTLGKVALHVLTDGTPVVGGPYIFNIVAGGADPARTIISPNLSATPLQVGKPQKFMVTVCDSQGMAVPEGSTVTCFFTDSAGMVLPPDDMNVKVSDEQNNQFVVSVRPETDGEVYCHVIVNDVEVPNSPFPMSITRAPASALTSIVKGGPFNGQPLVAGVGANFFVGLMDDGGRPAQPGSKVDIKFTDEAGRPLPANAIAVQQGVEQDGVLPITLVAGNTVKGKVLATVTVNGQPVNNGKPYVLDVTQPHLAVERNCFMKGLVAEEPGVQVYGFQVANQAMQGIPKPPIKAYLEDVSGRPVPNAKLDIVKISDIDYQLRLHTDGLQPGKRLCHVVCDDFEIPGAPFYVSIPKPACDPNMTQVLGPGLAAAKLNQQTSFVVNLFDAKGGSCEPGAHVDVLFGDELGNKIEDIDITISPEENGQVLVTYTPLVGGQMGLHVFVNDVLTNQGAPFPIFVESDENRVNSTEGTVNAESQFFVILQDADGNNILDMTPEVQIKDAAGNLYKFELDNHGDGSYTVKYVPLKEGQFFVQVSVGGEVIQEWPLTVGASSVNPAGCFSDWAQSEITLNKPYSVKVFLMDDKGQKTTTSAPTTLAFFNQNDQDVSNIATSKVDYSEIDQGFVTINFTVNKPGTFKMVPMINGEQINGTPYYVTVQQPKRLMEHLSEDISLPTIFLPSKFTVNPANEGFRPDGVVTVEFYDKNKQKLNFPTTIGQRQPNGDVLVTYTPTCAGETNMVVKIDGKEISQGFKLSVIQPKVDLSKTEVIGLDKFEKASVAGGKTEFSLRLFDEKKQPLQNAKVEIKFDDPTLNIPTTVSKDTYGNYKIGFENPTKSGELGFHVFVDEEEVVNLPWRLNIKSHTPSTLHSYITKQVPIVTIMNEHGEAILILRDQYKNNVKVGNVKVMAEKRDPALRGGPRGSQVRISRLHSRMFRLPTLKYYFDEQRDSNIISYSFPDIGDYNMHVFLDGEDIIGSPFHVICKPQLNAVAAEVDPSFPRLLRFTGKGQNIKSALVPLSVSSLNMNDCFVLDNWSVQYQWCASNSVFLVTKAVTMVQALNDSRSVSCSVKVIDNAWSQSDVEAKNFWSLFGLDAAPNQNTLTNNAPVTGDPTLYQIGGGIDNLQFSVVASGLGLKKSVFLKQKAIFLLDSGFDITIWEGKGVTGDQRTMCNRAGAAFIKQFQKAELTKVTKVVQGRENSILRHFVLV